MSSFSYISEAKSFKSYYVVIHQLLRKEFSYWKCLSFFRIPRRELLGLKVCTFKKCWMHLVSRNGETIFILSVIVASGVSSLRSSLMDVSFFFILPI